MKRFIITSLAAITAASTLPTYAADQKPNVSPAERAKIESVVHDYLIAKPEVLMEAMQVLQRKQYEQAEQTIKGTQQAAPQYANALFKQANDPIGGNAKGKITVTEFFDYQCPHCVDMAPVIEAIIKANPDVRIVYKEFPIRGPMSDFAARAALAANIQGKYYPVHLAILTAKQPLTQDMIYKFAKDNGVDVDKMKKDMDGSLVADQIKANIKLAQDLKLFGTPAFFIGKSDGKTNITYVPGQMDQKQLQKAIDEAGK